MINNLDAYANYRPDVDWNTCGQAAIATILDYHKVDPFGLPRSGGRWRDGDIIDALKNDGMGPDVIFGRGTSPPRIQEALQKYGLHAHGAARPLPQRSRSEHFDELRGQLDGEHSCPSAR